MDLNSIQNSNFQYLTFTKLKCKLHTLQAYRVASFIT